MDNLVYIYISVTVTLDDSQDLFFQNFYEELKFPGRLERELVWDWVQHDAFPVKEMWLAYCLLYLLTLVIWNLFHADYGWLWSKCTEPCYEGIWLPRRDD